MLHFNRATPPEGTRGMLLALLILTGLLALAAGVAWGVAQLTPALPAYTLLLYFVVIFVPLAVWAVRRLPWLGNWYYLLPALVFLLAFTVFPIALTVGFAFTNYSGENSGQPDSASSMEIAQISSDRTQLTIRELPFGAENLTAALACRSANCAGKKLALQYPDPKNPANSEQEAGTLMYYAQVKQVQGKTIMLTAALPSQYRFGMVTRINEVAWLGLGNFQDIFGKASIQLWPVFLWTVVFALSTVFINTLVGLFLGIMLSNKELKFRNTYRSLLFLPWAVPTVISVQMWVALLNQNFGIVNRVLALLGAYPIPWLNDPLWAKMSILLVNLWLGFPYMMTATISALASIPDDLYEAAEIDGASKWQQITYITLPLLKSAFTPILLSGFAFNFNNFGIIYLLTAGGPAQEGRTSTAQATDILISWGYNTAFSASGGAQYGFASAIAIVIAILTVAISVVNFRFAGVFKEAKS